MLHLNVLVFMLQGLLLTIRPSSSFILTIPTVKYTSSISRSIFLPATAKETMAADPNFSIFNSMVEAVPELNDLIKSDKIDQGFNMMTVFAPSNAAFAKLDKDIMSKLARKDNLAILKKMVRFHFVEDILTKEDVGQRSSLDTLALIPVSIKTVRGGPLGTGDVTGFKINEASITRADISCSNGIIHEVDFILSPFILFRYLVGPFPTP